MHKINGLTIREIQDKPDLSIGWLEQQGFKIIHIDDTVSIVRDQNGTMLGIDSMDLRWSDSRCETYLLEYVMPFMARG